MNFYKKNRSLLKSGHCFLLLSASLGMAAAGHSQNVSLNDLSFFDKPGATWRIAGDVNADLQKENTLTTKPGAGILVNLVDEKTHGSDLMTAMQHGDADVEFDYMMAKGSNSGVYLQGRYEVQLLDSWGVLRPRYGDNGGIYERWDEARGAGKEGYEGYAPRQNVSLAPGLWQHLKIAFQAPKFDAAGTKIQNARILKIELNGVTIHENVELLGPTRGSLGAEVAAGPLRIQGDHGAVAFRNLKVTSYDKPRPALSDLKYSLYKGKFAKEPDYSKLAADSKGSSAILTSAIDTKSASAYLVRYTGKLEIKEGGEYRFNLLVPGGGGAFKIDGNKTGDMDYQSNAAVNLSAGTHDFEVLYNKTEDWGKPAPALYIAGPGVREFLASDAAAVMSEVTDPIIADGIATPVLRSFMDLPGNGRVTHAVNVSSQAKVHYTYDLDKGNLVQVWRGGFLDATPMWHDRGDGSSRPLGATRLFGAPAFSLDLLAGPSQAWRTDSAGTAFRPKGYSLDAGDRPTFMFSIFGASVNDAISVMNEGKGFTREITVANAPAQLFVRLAKAASIESLGNGLYLVNDKAYYIQTTAEGVTIRDAGSEKELIAPVSTKLSYNIIF